MLKETKLKWVINPRRIKELRNIKRPDFKLSNYWNRQYKDVFKNW